MQIAQTSDGSFTLVDGCMFGGKSTWVLMRMNKYARAGRSCLSVTHSSDVRYSTESEIVTHSNLKIPAVRATSLGEIPEEMWRDKDVVAIDEGQFFGDIVEFVYRLFILMRKHVIVAALSGTFEVRPFTTIVPLYAMAQKIKRLSACCQRCGADAYFSQRLSDEKSLIVIGGSDQYEARCHKCFVWPSTSQ